MLVRQRFGDLPAGRDGLVSVGVVDGKVAFVSSSLATDTRLTGAVSISAENAVRAAAVAAGRAAGAISNVRDEDGWTSMDVAGYTDPTRARLVGVPTPADGVRQAYEVLLIDVAAEDPLGATSYVDAANGDLLVRDRIVDYAAHNPAWKVFPSSPPLDNSSTDTRELWCWNLAASVPGCQKAIANSASPAPWDVDAATDVPWFLTRGNNARATEKWNTNQGNAQGTNYAASATRDYVYPWTNQWYEARCNPSVFTSLQLNDVDAARANLHAMHNRMHDWSYHLGFTETTYNAQAFNCGKGGAQNDPEHGNAQAGGVVGGPPGFASRDNANQFCRRTGSRRRRTCWNAFARRGLGSGAASASTATFDPTPSFESPHADNATVTFVPAGEAEGRPVQLFVGRYEAAAVPVADTDPATPLGDTFRIVPGAYEFVARGIGFGAKRFTFSFDPGQVRDLPVNMSRNLASAANGRRRRATASTPTS